MPDKVKGTFKTLKTTPVYQGKIFALKQVRKKAPDNRIFQHDIIFHPGAAVIIPELPDGRLILLRQYRTAANRVLWEFPAGTLEPGESPLVCAKREIMEETGFKAVHWKKLTEFYPAPGFSQEFMS